jgi:hypothetical protein
MSELKVNKVSPQSGTDFTLGDSGDTFTVPSGATLTVAGTFTQTGAQTFDGGVDIDNFNINGTTIALSSGNMTIDAQGNDTDIIFKGTDGSADTTFLTIDGSAAGEATFNAGIVIADAGVIGSASDKDAIAIASNGQVTLTQTLIGTALDISGDIDVDGTTNLDIVDIDGAVNIAAAVTQSGGVFTQDGGAVFNEGSADVDFRVESNASANIFFIDGGNDNAGISTNAPDTDAMFHISRGGYRGAGTDKHALLVGADIGDANAMTNNARKLGSIVAPHYTNAEEPITIARLDSDNGSSELRIGGTAETNSTEKIIFRTGSDDADKSTGADRMVIDNAGNVIISKTSTSDTDTGLQTTTNGGLINVYNANGYSIQNRQADDGVFVYFKQANSTEGNISVSGTTVAYNTFTGTHWSRLADNSKPTILKGTVMESLDAMVDWYNLEFNDSDGNPQKIPHLLTDSQSNGDEITYDHNGTDFTATIVKETDIKHVQTKISTTDEAKNVYGVFHCWDFGDDDGINDMMIAAVGTYVIRIHKDETVAKGNLLQSNGDGTAKVLAGSTSITADVLSTVFAKVLSNTKIETYADGSFLVPCTFTNC